jgi:hypothetical protein
LTGWQLDHAQPVESLVFRVPPGQLRYSPIAAAVLRVIAAGLGAVAYFRPSPLIGMLTFGFGLGFAAGLWVAPASPREFTECPGPTRWIPVPARRGQRQR